ncbi:MAG: methyltransferase domain-containing protein [Alphaproteobacteria bacterium]|nr:methyltransferase domain-containing protein [Alphaproteobacteria bacterium]
MRDGRANIAFASATSLPVESATVTLMASTEVLEHIPPVDAAVAEMRRVCADGAVLVCTIPNNYCYKYDRKGKNIQHVNEWTYEGFIAFMRKHRFELISGIMLGKYVELPKWLSTATYQLPWRSPDEYHNTNFIYTFRAVA